MRGDDERGPDDRESAETPLWADQVVIPDDASELDADVADYQRELRAARRARRFGRVLETRRWRRYGLSGPLVATVLVMVAAVGSLLVLLLPRSPGRHDRGVPLATEIRIPPGAPGGLIPSVQLDLVGGGRKLASALRPAVVALMPDPCSCAATVDSLAGQAEEYGVPLILVAPDGDNAELPRLASRARRGQVTVALDARATLADSYHAEGVTVLALAADGRVDAVVRHVASDTRLEQALTAALLQQQASAG